MYVPKEESPAPSSGNWSVAFPHKDVSYVAPWDLDEYKRLGVYDHRCKMCKGKMKIIKEKQFEKMIRGAQFDRKPTKMLCPKCNEPLWLDKIIMWD